MLINPANMMSRLIPVLFVVLFSFQTQAQPASLAGHAEAAPDYEVALSTILSEIVTDDGLVRYDVLGAKHSDGFHRILKAVETFDLSTLSSHEAKLAFWMNAYNVHMLKNILDQPGLENVLANGMGDQFFKTPRLVGGIAISLDDLEHAILRGEDRDASYTPYQLASLDPRIHVGLNCAAVSCPSLPSKAFTAKNVNDLLDQAMETFVNSPQHFTKESGAWQFSSLLDWFGPDFDSTGKPAGDFLVGYLASHSMAEGLRTAIAGKSSAELKTIEGVTFHYDWTVNRAR